MKKKLVWVVWSGLLTLALLAASCQPAKPSQPAAPTAPTGTEERPKYGGEINLLVQGWNGNWDIQAVTSIIQWMPKVPLEQFMGPDWMTSFTAGGKIDWGASVEDVYAFGPELAESWKIPEIGTWIFQMRKGVHYALDPNNEASVLMGGREFTADDAVWAVELNHHDPRFPQAVVRRSRTKMAQMLTVEKTGPREVTLKIPYEPWDGFFWVAFGSSGHHMYPREVIEKYGDANAWWKVVGTGPYMITSHVADGATTMKKNDRWYKTNPAGPGKGDKLPYIDTVNMFIVPDVSTRVALMRTGKADWTFDLDYENAQDLLRSNPGLKYKKYIAGYPVNAGITGRTDKMPFSDKRVRQAMTLATDFNAFTKGLYHGEAETLVWPVASAYFWLYTPMEKLPQNVQALYQYNPERAKQLLAEAGYPNGFKAVMDVENISIAMDPAAAFKDMWRKVGIDLEIRPKESSVYRTILQTAQDDLRLGSVSSQYYFSIYGFSGLRGPTTPIKDNVIENAYLEMQKHVIIDQKAADKIFRETVPYILEQAYVIPKPSPYVYTMWQPWVKNYTAGERYGTDPFFLGYIWIDRDMKRAMGY